MILADTSVWVEHLRTGETLTAPIAAGRLLMHPYVLVELALGSLRARPATLGFLRTLIITPVADVGEVGQMIEERRLFSRGIGFVDTSLLASCLLQPGLRLWTRDRRLAAAAADLDILHAG